MRIVWALISLFSLALAAGPYSTAATARRERNLDHLDPDTLSFYLGIDPISLEPIKGAGYVGHDVAVMFYAQWDQNSHSLAPYWDNIAVKLRAGTKQSKLIMGLFNCELDFQHVQLCNKAGVKHYPTILFVGAGPFHDTDPFTRIVGKDRSAGPAGAATLPRTVKFQGNWQYTESIKDWIKAMQGLSSWHQLTNDGFLKNFRKGLLGIFVSGKKDKSSSSLPVGLPGSSGGGKGVSSAQVSKLESKLESVKSEGKLMERAATHASLLLDNVLFPPENQDVFAAMTERGGWNKTSPNASAEVQVLRTCVTELSLDYCTRLSTRITADFLDDALKKGDEDFGNIYEIEEELKRNLVTAEPYCGLFDECYASNFTAASCRPDKCPFQAVGCSYLTACFDTSVQKEYALALGLIKEGETFPSKQKEEVANEAAEGNSKGNRKGKDKGGWGFF